MFRPTGESRPHECEARPLRRRTRGRSPGGFPDLAVEVVDVVEQHSRVAVWMRLSGTQDGEFSGHPPSGRHATWDEVGFFTVDRDRIVACRYLADMFGLRKALGIIPPRCAEWICGVMITSDRCQRLAVHAPMARELYTLWQDTGRLPSRG